MSDAAVPRPATVTAAAAVTALPGAALAVFGVFELVDAVAGHPAERGAAVTLGVIYIAMGLGIVWVARGLLACRAWARTPSFLTHALIAGIAYWMFQGGYDVAGALSIVYGVAGIVLLFTPGAHRVLTR